MIYDNYSEKNDDDVTEYDEGDVITAVIMMLMAMSMVLMRRMMKRLVTLM